MTHIPTLALPSPQATMSQLSALSGGGGGGATLLHEVMSFLRRCLTQVRVNQCAWLAGLFVWALFVRIRGVLCCSCSAKQN